MTIIARTSPGIASFLRITPLLDNCTHVAFSTKVLLLSNLSRSGISPLFVVTSNSDAWPKTGNVNSILHLVFVFLLDGKWGKSVRCLVVVKKERPALQHVQHRPFWMNASEELQERFLFDLDAVDGGRTRIGIVRDVQVEVELRRIEAAHVDGAGAGGVAVDEHFGSEVTAVVPNNPGKGVRSRDGGIDSREAAVSTAHCRRGDVARANGEAEPVVVVNVGPVVNIACESDILLIVARLGVANRDGRDLPGQVDGLAENETAAGCCPSRHQC